jgi:aspartic proteinase inhibitor
MKKSLQVVIILVALGVAFGCAMVSFGQGRPIVGGYKEVATDDPEVQAAAEFAVSEQKKKQDDAPLSLVSIEHAERQVVAGMNYRLCLKVKAADEDDAGVETQDVKVVVFKSLKKEYSLKSWDEEDCSEAQQ